MIWLFHTFPSIQKRMPLVIHRIIYRPKLVERLLLYIVAWELELSLLGSLFGENGQLFSSLLSPKHWIVDEMPSVWVLEITNFHREKIHWWISRCPLSVWNSLRHPFSRERFSMFTGQGTRVRSSGTARRRLLWLRQACVGFRRGSRAWPWKSVIYYAKMTIYLKTLSASMSVAYPPQGRIHRNYGKNYGKNYGEIHVKSGENHIDLIWTCGVYGKGYKKGFCPPVTYQPELWKYQGKEPRKTSGKKPWKYSF